MATRAQIFAAVAAVDEAAGVQVLDAQMRTLAERPRAEGGAALLIVLPPLDALVPGGAPAARPGGLELRWLSRERRREVRRRRHRLAEEIRKRTVARRPNDHDEAAEGARAPLGATGGSAAAPAGPEPHAAPTRPQDWRRERPVSVI